MARAVSTVLDVALFLLLVSAAVAVLHAVPEAEERTDADVAPAVATTLATTTTTVQYEPSDDGSTAAGQARDVRTDRSSVVGLLARATATSATAEDEPLSQDRAYRRAVRNETQTVLRSVDGAQVQVRAVWEPLPGADVRGETTVGPTPPPTADVHVATTSVPLGTARDAGVAAPQWRTGGQQTDGDSQTDDGAGARTGTAALKRSLRTTAAIEGCSGLADAIARRIVGTYFPPGQTAAALHGEEAAQTRARYRTFADATGVDPEGVPLDGDARGTNALLVDALAVELEPTACSGYEDSRAAAIQAAPDSVTVVVRTWSP